MTATFTFTLTETFDVALLERSLLSPIAQQTLVLGEYRNYGATLGYLKEHGGKQPVEYYVDNEYGIGRFKTRQPTPKTNCNMMRELRAVANKSQGWVDVDMVNAHYVIAFHLANKLDIETPYIQDYCATRDAKVDEVKLQCGVSRDTAKNLFIRELFGGSIKEWCKDMRVDNATVPEFVRDLKHELDEVMTNIVGHDDFKMFRDYAKEIGKTKVASTFSLVMQTFERLIIERVVVFFQEKNIEVGAIIYDGLHIRLNQEAIENGTEAIDADLLAELEETIREEMNIDMKFSIKPFEINPLWLGQPLDDDWMKEILPYEEMKAFFETRWLKSIANGCFLDLETNTTHNEAYMTTSFKHLNCFVKIGEKTLKKRFMPEWLHDSRMRTVAKIDFLPPPLVCPSGTYNMWNGFKVSNFIADKPVDTNSEGVRLILKHLKYLTNHKEGHDEYLLDWIARRFQQPGVKSGVCIVLYGAEGVGKNLFAYLLRDMMGLDKFSETPDMERVMGKFNAVRLNKLLIVLNELSKSSTNYIEQMKDAITSESFSMEKKGLDIIDIQSVEDYIITTNNDNCLKIPPKNRRFCMFEADKSIENEVTYFDPLVKALKDPHVRYEFYKLIMARDISHVQFQRDRPISDALRDMMESSIPIEIVWLRYEIDENLNKKEPVLEIKEQSSKLYNRFDQWRGVNGYEFSMTQQAFSKRISGWAEQGRTASIEGVRKVRKNNGCYIVFDLKKCYESAIKGRWMRLGECPRFNPCVVRE